MVKILTTLENFWGRRGKSSSCKGSPSCGGLKCFEEQNCFIDDDDDDCKGNDKLG